MGYVKARDQRSLEENQVYALCPLAFCRKDVPDTVQYPGCRIWLLAYYKPDARRRSSVVDLEGGF